MNAEEELRKLTENLAYNTKKWNYELIDDIFRRKWYGLPAYEEKPKDIGIRDIMAFKSDYRGEGLIILSIGYLRNLRASSRILASAITYCSCSFADKDFTLCRFSAKEYRWIVGGDSEDESSFTDKEIKEIKEFAEKSEIFQVFFDSRLANCGIVGILGK